MSGSVSIKKIRLIAEMGSGERLEDAVFLVAQKDLRTASNGKLYISLVLADRSGQASARIWDANQTLFDSIPLKKLACVRGRTELYKSKLQLVVDGIREAPADAANPGDFLPTTKFDVEAMWARVKEILRSVQDPDLLALLGTFINDERFTSAFKRSPAARSNHHAFIGGLLEHTLSLLELALVVLPRYPRVSRDLVLSGIFLHDCGKAAELNAEAGFDYTTEGQLLGHIVQGVIWLHERAAQVAGERGRPVTPATLMALKHILVAHHGKREFGSPTLPAMPEAMMLHYLDNLDAKLNMAFNAIDADPDESSEWTGYIQTLESRIYKGPRPPAG